MCNGYNQIDTLSPYNCAIGDHKFTRAYILGRKKYKDERNRAIAAQEKIGETVLLKLCVQHNHKIGVSLILNTTFTGGYFMCVSFLCSDGIEVFRRWGIHSAKLKLHAPCMWKRILQIFKHKNTIKMILLSSNLISLFPLSNIPYS